MADFLSKAEWQKLLKQKEHKDIKKTGVSELLDELANARKQNDTARQVETCDDIVKKAEELKKNKKFKTIASFTTYLDSMIKEAKVAKNKAQVGEGKEQDPSKKVDSPLHAQLQKVKKLERRSAWNFIAAPGRASSGLVLSRKEIQAQDRKTALALRGKPGVFFEGVCYGDAGRYVFELADTPPNGLAKGIKRAALLHADIAIKVTVRGAGVDLTDEDDEDLGDTGTEGTEGPTASKIDYPTKDIWLQRLQKLASLKPEVRAEAASGVLGEVARLKGLLINDGSLDETEKDAQRKLLESVRERALSIAGGAIGNHRNLAMKPPRPPTYEPLETWKGLIEKIQRLDMNVREKGVSMLLTKLAKTREEVINDSSLSEEQRAAEIKVLVAAVQLAKQATQDQRTVLEGARSTNLSDRVKSAEKDLERTDMLSLPEDTVKRLQAAHREMRAALKEGSKDAAETKLSLLEGLLKEALKTGKIAQALQNKANDQTKQFEEMTKGLEFVDKAALPKGTAKAIAQRKDELGADKGLTKVAFAIAECETNKSPDAIAKLTSTCEDYLKDIARQKESAKGDKVALTQIAEREKIAKQALQQARLLELSADYRSLGMPPWDEAKAEQAAELQMTFLFEEAAVKRGVDGVELGLSPLGGEGGVNESYWIKRSEKGYGKDAKSERLYIFKPGEFEDGSFYGMPKGHGAPREVLAKSMSDQMANFGFDIGVCPTTLASVDTSKLGGKDEGGRTLGAMQALANNTGEFRSLREKKDVDLGQKIDSRNYGEIAVFDMLYFNMDRHGGNLLTGPEDPETGKVPLIPIDHGLGLPNKETLYMNTGRLLEEQNTLMKDNVPQRNELLHEDVRANLKAMDPAEFVNGMRKSRDDLAKRHPETAGTVTDEALIMMERRASFMKFACDQLTVKQLNEANAIHAWDIQHATSDKDFQSIVEQVKRESGLRDEGRKVFAMWTAESNQKDKLQYLKPLTDLGWCTELSGDQDRKYWIDKNADMAAKIIRGQIPNPAAKKEISQRIDMIGDPGLYDQITSLTVGEQLKVVRNKAPYEWEILPTGKDESALQERFNQLGGDDELAKAAKHFDVGCAHDKLAVKIQDLAAWNELQTLGGLDAYFELGGEHMDKLVFITRRLRELKAERSSRNAVLAIDDDQLSKRQNQHMLGLSEQTSKQIAKLRNRDKRAGFEEKLTQARQLVESQKPDEAQAKLVYLSPAVTKGLENERIEFEALKKAHQALSLRIGNADPSVVGGLTKEIENWLKDANTKIDAGVFDGLRREMTVYGIKLDVALQGDESEYRKIETEIGVLSTFGEKILRGEALAKWQQLMNNAKKALEIYDLSLARGAIIGSQAIKKAAERLPELRKKAEEYKERPQHSKLSRAIEGIEKSIAAFDTTNAHNNAEYSEELIKEMSAEKEPVKA